MNIHLIPHPKQLNLQTNINSFSKLEPIEFDNNNYAFAADHLYQEAKTYIAGTLPEQLSSEKSGRLVIKLLSDNSIKSAAYRLLLKDGVLSIISGSTEGVWYAIQTTLQLLFQAQQQDCELQLPQLSIEDEPKFSYRGMHLDVSRHFFDVDFIKKYIDLIALHKMNYFHWHLTDDQGWRIEIEKYPKLVEVGAFRAGTVVGHTLDAGSTVDEVKYGDYYTKDDVREIVAYAAKRHITVVPEIDVPGHAAALLAAYPEYGCGSKTDVKTHFGIFKHVLCPSEATFSFLDDIFNEIAELFPGPYIHIGGDEVIKDHWGECKCCQQIMFEQGLENVEQLHAYFVNRTEKIINQYDKHIIGWDEILDSEIHKSATIMLWRGIERGLQAAEKGHNVIMSPAAQLYFDAYQSTSLDEPLAIHGLTRLGDVYAFNPAPDLLSEYAKSKILGGQANLWTEYISTEQDAEYMLLPRMCALAEVLWGKNPDATFDNFLLRLGNFIPYVKTLGFNVSDCHYKPELQVKLQSDGQFLINMNASKGVVFYTIDGTLPNLNSHLYQGIFYLKEACTIRARTWVDSLQQWHGDCTISIDPHKGTGSVITLANTSEVSCNASSGKLLCNGVIASDRIFQHSEWLQFWGEKLDAVIEFSEQTTVSSVSIGVLGLHRKLYKPTEIAVYSGEPDQDWILVGYMNATDIENARGRLTFDFTAVVMERLRFVAVNEHYFWSAEREDMVRSTVSIDEIVIH